MNTPPASKRTRDPNLIPTHQHATQGRYNTRSHGQHILYIHHINVMLHSKAYRRGRGHHKTVSEPPSHKKQSTRHTQSKIPSQSSHNRWTRSPPVIEQGKGREPTKVVTSITTREKPMPKYIFQHAISILDVKNFNKGFHFLNNHWRCHLSDVRNTTSWPLKGGTPWDQRSNIWSGQSITLTDPVFTTLKVPFKDKTNTTQGWYTTWLNEST